MASMALSPNVVDYMDIMTKNGVTELEVEEMLVGDQSKLAGHRLGKALADGEIGATVIAINGVDGTSQCPSNGPGSHLSRRPPHYPGSQAGSTSASELIR